MRALLLFILFVFALVLEASSAAIHEAAKKGDVAALTVALDAGADVDENSGGATPLVFAAVRGHAAAAKLLIARGANVNVMSKLGSPLMAAAAKGGPEMVSLLLAAGANPSLDMESRTALHVAAESGCFDCVKALVEAGANVNAQHRQVSTQHTLLTTPIHLAILYEHGDVADFLMAHGVIIPKPAPITDKIAAADPEKGRMFFENNCQHCHIVLPELGEIGPHLWNTVGRDKASLDYKGYSKTLRAWEGVWTYEDLNVYLSGPAVTTPGVNMQTEGATNETDRVNVIAYLRTLSDNPVPLP